MFHIRKNTAIPILIVGTYPRTVPVNFLFVLTAPKFMSPACAQQNLKIRFNKLNKTAHYVNHSERFVSVTAITKIAVSLRPNSVNI